MHSETAGRRRVRRGWVIGAAVMAIFALTFAFLASSALGIILAAVGGIGGYLLGVPLLGGSARADLRRGQPSRNAMAWTPFAVVLGMFVLPRVFELIGLSLGWALAAGASAFLAAATYATSRSEQVFGSSG